MGQWGKGESMQLHVAGSLTRITRTTLGSPSTHTPELEMGSASKGERDA